MTLGAAAPRRPVLYVVPVERAASECIADWPYAPLSMTEVRRIGLSVYASQEPGESDEVFRRRVAKMFFAVMQGRVPLLASYIRGRPRRCGEEW